MPAWTIVRRSGKKTSSTVQSKLPVARSPATSQLPSTIRASDRLKTPRQYDELPSGLRRGSPPSRIWKLPSIQDASWQPVPKGQRPVTR
jgi:hypothetical protein